MKPWETPVRPPQHSLWFERALLPHGWAAGVRLGINGSRIASVQANVAQGSGDERHAIAVPGMPNLHSHAFQRAIAGLTSRRGAAADSFWTWREVMYRFVDRLMPEDIEVIAAQAYVEMLEAGFTRVGEFHYLHHAPDGSPYVNPAENCMRIASAADETGIALTLLPVLYAQGGFGGLAPSAAQRRFICDEQQYGRLLEAARALSSSNESTVVGVAPHSLRAVTPAQLEAIARMAMHGPVHIHVAEQMKEVEGCIAWSGQRPVEWLLEHAAVDSRWCLVHATHANAREILAAARTGAVVGLCPITEADLGDGVFAAADFIRAGGAFGIGSDSNVLIDVAQELRWLEYGQRLVHQSRNVLAMSAEQSTGRSLFEHAWRGGCIALGVPAMGLSLGAAADIVTLDVDHPSFVARNDDELLDSWIFGARTPAVDCVWRAGKRVVHDGVHSRREEIARRYSLTLSRLLA